jgi:hypothetical protein
LLADGQIFIDVPEPTVPIRAGRFRGDCGHGDGEIITPAAGLQLGTTILTTAKVTL